MGFGHQWQSESVCGHFRKKVQARSRAGNNEYSVIEGVPYRAQRQIPTIVDETARDTLKSLNEGSAIGPDMLPAVVGA